MPLLDDILDIVTHPAVHPLLLQAVMGNPREDLDRRLSAAEKRLDAIQRDGRDRNHRHKSATTHGGGSGLPEIRDQVIGISGRLDEALRFARESGIHHPEAKQRLQDAQMAVLELERCRLMPEQAQTPEERRMAEALAPRVRKLRQKVLNRLWSVEDLADASAAAGDLVTAVQTAVMARDAGGQSPLSNMADDDGYGRDGLAKGCIPCALGHLGMAAGSLGRAAIAGPAEQAKRVAMVQKELDMLLAYDWVEQKIAQNTPQEQAVIRDYQPRIVALRDRVSTIRGPADVASVSAEATALWESFKSAVDRLPAPPHYNRPARRQTPLEAIREADARVDRAYQAYGFIAPRRRDLQAEAERTNYATLMQRVVDTTGGLLGVQWLTQPLFGEDALYIPATNTVIRTAEAKEPENYHLQTTIHEASHALLQNQRCFPAGLTSPKAREIGETEADLVTIATMSELGLPLEYGDGTREAAGDYTVDWTAVRQHFGPEVAQRVQWATGWLVTAAQNGQPAGTCPPPPPIPAPPVLAPGVSRPVGTGLQVPRERTDLDRLAHPTTDVGEDDEGGEGDGNGFQTTMRLRYDPNGDLPR
jgi:hypothetical protein